jgi:hypothetical protein
MMPERDLQPHPWRTLLAWAAALAAAMLLAACGEHAPTTGGIVARAVLPAFVTQQAGGAAQPLAAPPLVTTMRATVSGPNMTAVIQDFPATPGADGNGVVQDVPAGTGRWLTLEGLDGSNTVIYRGGMENITVTTGQDEDVGVVYLAPEAGYASVLPTYDTFDAAPDVHYWGAFNTSGCTTRDSGDYHEVELASTGINDSCALFLYEPRQMRTLSADVRVTAYTQTTGDIHTRIEGHLYASVTGSPDSLAGNVHAQLRLEDFDPTSGTGVANAIVVRCTDQFCQTFTLLGSAVAGSVQLDQLHSLTLAWDGATTIVFQVDQNHPVGFDVGSQAPFVGPPNGFSPEIVLQVRDRNAASGNTTVRWEHVRCARADGSACQAESGTALYLTNLPVTTSLQAFAFNDTGFVGYVQGPVGSGADVLSIWKGREYSYGGGITLSSNRTAITSGNAFVYVFDYDTGTGTVLTAGLFEPSMVLDAVGPLPPVDTTSQVAATVADVADGTHLYCMWHHLSGVDPILDGVFTGLYADTVFNSGFLATMATTYAPWLPVGANYNLSCVIDVDGNFDWNAPAVTPGDFFHASTGRPIGPVSLTDSDFNIVP